VNVVFDLGGVVVTWDPDAFVASLFSDAVERRLVLDGVLGDEDWVELDRGSLAPTQAIARAARRTGIDARRLEALFAAVPASLVPVPQVVRLVEELRAAGNRLYVLSNLHRATLAYLEAATDVFALFDGRVISCEVGAVKPETAIYRLLLESLALEPERTVFIDDVQANLEAAADQGIDTILFEGAAACRVALMARGCFDDGAGSGL
jgi:putative hydrolase of the HAD superfamily